MIDVIIKDFPLPPSVNNAYIPVMNKIVWRKGKPQAKGRMVKSKEHSEYESKCLLWELNHKTGVEKLRSEIIKREKEMLAEGKHLSIKLQMYAILSPGKIYSNKLTLNKIDADNFTKLAQDKLTRILCIDDKHVFKNEIEKLQGKEDKIIIHIKEYTPITEDELAKRLGI